MAKVELKLPKMGESVAEATVTAWLKQVGDKISVDDPILEVATDKVDTEVPSEVNGVLVEQLFQVDDVVEVGQTLAIIEVAKGEKKALEKKEDTPQPVLPAQEVTPVVALKASMSKAQEVVAQSTIHQNYSNSQRFYSPLVRNIANKEGISLEELDRIPGSGLDHRLTKQDLLAYLKNGKQQSTTIESATTDIVEEKIAVVPSSTVNSVDVVNTPVKKCGIASADKEEIQEAIVNEGESHIAMTRMGKLIAKHMVQSVQTSAHVQSFIEVDVTNICKWRDKIKNEFQKREGEKFTFTPIFMEAIAKALKDYPMMNISLEGDTIIKKKNINLGMATALPDGNLIVPVIKNADQLNLVGMAKAVNALANKARTNSLSPDDTQGGTYTVTNVGSFGTLMGTPIINQPQVGILALGAIRKIPAVIETSEGDYVGIRQKMFLSHSYDHRVVNGALGGMFVKRVGEYLENWDLDRIV